MKVKYALLDVDGVILIPNIRKSGVLKTDIIKRLVQTIGRGLDLGKVKFKRFLDRYNELANQDLSQEGYFEEVYRFMHFNKDLIDFLLKKNLSICVLSNNYKENVAFFREKYGFGDWSSLEVYSCDLGIKKPDSKMFRHILRKLNAKPEDFIFIDDAEKNVLAAKKLGFNSILFSDNKKVFMAIDRES